MIPAYDENERFFTFIDFGRDLTVWGHTVDKMTARYFPESLGLIEKARADGREFGWWYSRACLTGAPGINHRIGMRSITLGMFEIARANQWPSNY